MLIRNLLTFAVCSTLIVSGLVSADSVDRNALAGKWVLDQKKSPSGKFAPAHLVQEIKMNGANIVVESKFDEPKNGIYPIFWVGLMTQKLELTADGSEKLNQVGPYALSSKTTVDGNKMVTDWVAVNDPGKVEGQWIRTLSADGKEMTMNLKGKSSDGRVMDGTFVFVRK